MTATADERAGPTAASAAAEAQAVAPHTEVTTALLLGDPAPVLLGLADAAGMLVVGTRGPNHAACPVLMPAGEHADPAAVCVA